MRVFPRAANDPSSDPVLVFIMRRTTPEAVTAFLCAIVFVGWVLSF